MKDSLYLFVLLLSSTTLTDCEAIADIFKAGVWVGVLPFYSGDRAHCLVP